MNPLMLVAALVALGFPVVYKTVTQGRVRAPHARSSGLSPAEAHALGGAAGKGDAGGADASGADAGGGIDIASLLASLLGGAGLGSADYGQNLSALESGVQNSYDGSGYPSIPGAYAPTPTTAEYVGNSPGGTQPPATGDPGTAGGGSADPYTGQYVPPGSTYTLPSGQVTSNPQTAILQANVAPAPNVSYAGAYSAPSAKYN